MVDEFLGEPSPGAIGHLGPCHPPHPLSQEGVADNGIDGIAQGPRAVRVEEQARLTLPDEVEWSTASRCHDGKAGGGGLLQGLAEGLAGARVDEDIERGIGPGEGIAGALAEEDRCPVRAARSAGHGLGQHRPDVRASRSVADEHQSRPRDGGHLGQAPELLFGGEPAHIAHEHLPAGGKSSTEFHRS